MMALDVLSFWEACQVIMYIVPNQRYITTIVRPFETEEEDYWVYA